MPVLSEKWKEHPCFGGCGPGRYGRIHLPVAPKCNVQCAFCDRRYDCANESRPGVTSRILTPEQAAQRAVEALREEPKIRVVGIAGPGDPLANEETFETLRRVKVSLPEVLLCLSTNGMWLEERLEELLACGVDTLTVTVNTLRPENAARLYTHVTGPEGRLTGLEAGEYLVERQAAGIRAWRGAGGILKINTVLVPGVNAQEVSEIADMARQVGAAVMNVMPLIPCGSMACAPAPTARQLWEARELAAERLPVLRYCRQCRADAVGLV